MHSKIKDYKITDKLAESRSTRVYRAYRIANGESVVLKILKPDAATRGELTRFRREFEITSRFDLPGIVKALALEDDEEGLTIVFQDISGQSLDHILEQAPLSLTASLEVAIALADTVGLLHKRRIIHKDINPSHIIFNPTTRQVNLIGFGLADELPERSVTPLPPSALEGTLAYMSPEQTGRMNRPVDYRTDFYSLGVTIYQMLTGKLPFEADDALGMVHSHIAKTPVPPHELNDDIPKMVSLMVMKLMSKMADDRYQNAFGLKADLEKCWRGLIDEGVVREFELGREDFSDQLRFPEKLYGRAGELDQLFHAFERVSHGERELLLVAGYAGVGKTRLVREIHKTVIEKQGYLIEGKFDQLQQNMPYLAWIQALGGLVKYILMEGEAGLAQWKENILSALGGIGKVLTDVIPNLELVIGAQPDVTPLGSVEAQNRFNYVFLEFIKAIATREHPLVVFLDDLQWIDGASLNLLETLMSSTGVLNILVIGAYRDNEVDTFHPLMKTVAALRAEAARVDLLKLKDLAERTVNELIADIVYGSPVETAEQTHLVYAKTSGNPFFLRQTLRTLVEKQAIFFDINSRQWRWDISILKGLNITDNVVDLMLEKIRLLSPETQRLLPLAACIGFKFDLFNLGIIAEQPEDAVMESLRPALREGLVVPLGDEFQFVHDRVQQAAYSLIPAKEKKQVHLKIGKLLLKHLPEHDQAEQLFTVVDHLNIGAELQKDRNDKLELARLNLRAGSKAKDSAAFSAAAKYFEAGVAMLDDESWQTDYDLALALHSRAADAESLVGEVERTDQLFTVVTGKAKTAEDMVEVYLSQMHSYISQGKLQEAVDISLEGFEKLGLSLPGYPTGEDIARAIEETKSLYANIPIADLINLPKMTDPNKIAMMLIHKKSGPAAYISRPAYVLLEMLSQVELTIRYGNADESPNTYAVYAFFLCGFQREYEEGYRFAKLALSLLETVDSSKIMSKTMCMIGGHVWHFRHHLRETLPYLEKGYQDGLKTGDFENAGYDAEFCCSNSYFAGVELPQLEQLIDFYGESVRRIRAETAARIIAPYWQAVKNLLSTSGDPTLLAGEKFNQEEMLPLYEQTHNDSGLAAFYVNRLVLSYLFEDYEQALRSAELAENHSGGMLGMFTHSASIFYDSLARLQIYPHSAPLEQAQILERVSANQQVMKGLADSAPMNFLHKFYLVEAERHRLAGEDMVALDCYDRAISLAGENEYLQEKALANELAAKFWLGKNKGDIARVYLEKARHGYEAWGARRKVQDLEERYSYLPGLKPRRERTGTALELLDLSTLMKTTRAISSEIEMDKLLYQVMHIVIENAGAESGFLLLEHEGVWQITAKGGIGTAELQISLPVSIEESDAVAQSVVRFVARTKESIVLDDAASQGEFINDPHLKQERTKSLFCAPLLSRGRLIGILYLENTLTTQAFTAERIQLLEILLSQAAISLENARIYEALRNSEEKYRRLVDTASEGIWMLGPDLITTFVNARMAEMTGYAAEELIGRPFTEVMFEEDWPDHYQRLENRKQGISENYERRFRRKDGQTVWTHVSATPVFDDKHQFNGTFGMFTDITESKQVEKALKVSEERFRRLAENARDVIYRMSLPDGLYEYISPAVSELFGYTPEEFYGSPQLIGRVIHPDWYDYFEEQWSRLSRGDMPPTYEYPIIHKSGDVRWVNQRNILIRDDGDRIVAIEGIVTDITERKRAEIELEQRAIQLGLINNISAQITEVLELEPLLNEVAYLVHHMFNYHHVAIFLIEGERLHLKAIAGSYTSYFPAGHSQRLDQGINGWVATHGEKVVANDVSRDPHYISLIAAHSVTRSELCLPLIIAGQTVGVLDIQSPHLNGFSQNDVMAMEALAHQLAGAVARARLIQTHLRLSAAIEQAGESIIITDLKGKIIYVNPTFERVSGYSRAEAVGQNPRILKSGRHDAAFYETLWATISAGQVWYGRLINKKKDGILYTEDATITSVRAENGALINYVGVKRDVTQQLQLEEQYRQAQKMEAIGRLAGGVAHDFNNILVVIIGYSELLYNHLDGDSPMRKYAEEIRQAGNRAAGLTRQLLAFSRQQILQPQNLQLNAVVGNMEKMLRRLIGEDIDLFTKLAPELGRVKADAGQIEQIIMNLAVNARDAMPRGGQLTIETANIEWAETYVSQHAEAEPGLYVMLAMSDTGIGMDAATQARIFEPFFTTKELGLGTGLGLATVYGIVKQSGGHIWVYSELGHGTTFKIYLPRVHETAPAVKPGSASANIPAGHETVLLVEDEEAVREVTRRILQAAGYTVLEASHGDEAFRLSEQHRQPIHLLVTDVIMPHQSGPEVAKRLAALHPETKVLFISGYTDQAIAQHGMLEPGLFYLPKPFSPNTLARKVREVLDTPSTGQ